MIIDFFLEKKYFRTVSRINLYILSIKYKQNIIKDKRYKIKQKIMCENTWLISSEIM